MNPVDVGVPPDAERSMAYMVAPAVAVQVILFALTVDNVEFPVVTDPPVPCAPQTPFGEIAVILYVQVADPAVAPAI